MVPQEQVEHLGLQGQVEHQVLAVVVVLQVVRVVQVQVEHQVLAVVVVLQEVQVQVEVLD